MNSTQIPLNSNLLSKNLKVLQQTCDYTISIAGNPNVGKSTIFNALTGMHQHTGNWPGKTVSNAGGVYNYQDKNFLLVDIPGTYSLRSNSEEEEIAMNFICSGISDVTVVVVDATCLERNLNLVYQILAITPNVIVCVNLLDEAKKKGISVDLQLLSSELGVPVVGTIARKKKTLKNLMNAIYTMCVFSSRNLENCDISCIAGINNFTDNTTSHFQRGIDSIENIVNNCEILSKKVIHYDNTIKNVFYQKLDKLITSKIYGIPIMILFLGLVLWLTISGANYPSRLLRNIF